MAKSGDGHTNGVDNDWLGSCNDDAVLKRPADVFEDVSSGYRQWLNFLRFQVSTKQTFLVFEIVQDIEVRICYSSLC